MFEALRCLVSTLMLNGSTPKCYDSEPYLMGVGGGAFRARPDHKGAGAGGKQKSD